MEKKDSDEKFQKVLDLTTAEICEEVREETGIVFSKQMIAALSHVAFRQTSEFARDLEMFAQHARRKKITPDDVLMLARKTPTLHKHLSAFKTQK